MSTAVRLALFFIDAENVYDAGGIADAKRTINQCALRRSRAEKSSAALLVTLGTCSFAKSLDLAVVTDSAYRASDAAGNSNNARSRPRSCLRSCASWVTTARRWRSIRSDRMEHRAQGNARSRRCRATCAASSSTKCASTTRRCWRCPMRALSVTVAMNKGFADSTCEVISTSRVSRGA